MIEINFNFIEEHCETIGDVRSLSEQLNPKEENNGSTRQA
jgi:hypothetical protein